MVSGSLSIPLTPLNRSQTFTIGVRGIPLSYGEPVDESEVPAPWQNDDATDWVDIYAVDALEHVYARIDPSSPLPTYHPRKERVCV